MRQFDWWEGMDVGGVKITATPAQHFSGRGLNDAGKTLWASWVIRHDGLRLFFSGDTGYFKGFREIGAKYGPFDVALLETGACDKRWPDVHMQPEETMQAFLDLGLHRWRDPFDRIAMLADEQGVKLTTPEMGEALDLKQPHAGGRWWRGLK